MKDLATISIFFFRKREREKDMKAPQIAMILFIAETKWKQGLNCLLYRLNGWVTVRRLIFWD